MDTSTQEVNIETEKMNGIKEIKEQQLSPSETTEGNTEYVNTEANANQSWPYPHSNRRKGSSYTPHSYASHSVEASEFDFGRQSWPSLDDTKNEKKVTSPQVSNYRGRGRKTSPRGGYRGSATNYRYKDKRYYGGSTAPYYPAYPSQVLDPEALSYAILSQVEYYFSTNNLIKDVYLRTLMDVEGYVTLVNIRNFNRIRSLNIQVEDIIESIRDSELVEIAESSDKIRRRNNWEDFLIPKDFNPAGTTNPSSLLLNAAPFTPSTDSSSEQQPKRETMAEYLKRKTQTAKPENQGNSDVIQKRSTTSEVPRQQIRKTVSSSQEKRIENTNSGGAAGPSSGDVQWQVAGGRKKKKKPGFESQGNHANHTNTKAGSDEKSADDLVVFFSESYAEITEAEIEKLNLEFFRLEMKIKKKEIKIDQKNKKIPKRCFRSKNVSFENFGELKARTMGFILCKNFDDFKTLEESSEFLKSFKSYKYSKNEFLSDKENAMEIFRFYKKFLVMRLDKRIYEDFKEKVTESLTNAEDKNGMWGLKNLFDFYEKTLLNKFRFEIWKDFQSFIILEHEKLKRKTGVQRLEGMLGRMKKVSIEEEVRQLLGQAPKFYKTNNNSHGRKKNNKGGKKKVSDVNSNVEFPPLGNNLPSGNKEKKEGKENVWKRKVNTAVAKGQQGEAQKVVENKVEVAEQKVAKVEKVEG